MNEQILQTVGLTFTEARTYICLIKNSPCTPPTLAQLTQESRTNTYKLLDSLESKGLVTRDESQKKLRYWANNPSSLLDIAKKQRSEAESAEKRLQSALPELLDEYFKHSSQPGVRFYRGKSGINRVFDEQLADAKEIIYIRNQSDIDFLGFEFMTKVRETAANSGIPRTSISPITPQVLPNWKQHEQRINQKRIWFDSNRYTAPVEWSVFGDKVAAISYSEETISMIIESPQIAASMRQILTMASDGLTNNPNYAEPPNT